MCPNDKLRLIAHSLGSRVTLSAIQWIYDNDNERDNALSKKITSTHLLGAAIDNEQVSMNSDDCSINKPPLPCNGIAIKSEVERFYNLYNPEDNMLQFSYRETEGDDALGWCGVKGGPQNIFNPSSCVGDDSIRTPDNYEEHNVISEIRPDADADKDGKCDLRITFLGHESCTIAFIGDNHFGYLGYRSGINEQMVNDNGAIGFVTMNWRNE